MEATTTDQIESLTLWDYSDRELLQLVLDEQDEKSGYAPTTEIAKALGLTGKRRNQCVGARLAWLRRYGAVAVRAGGGMWAVTQIGQDLIDGRLRAPQQHAVDEASESELLLLTRRMAQRQRAAGITAGHLVRREWRRGTG